MSEDPLKNYRSIQRLTSPTSDDVGLVAGYMKMTEFILDPRVAYLLMLTVLNLRIVATAVTYNGVSHPMFMLVPEASFVEAHEHFQEWVDVGMPCSHGGSDDVRFAEALKQLESSPYNLPHEVWWAIDERVAWSLRRDTLMRFMLHGYSLPSFG